MKHWDLNSTGSSNPEGDDPVILVSADEGRAILLHLAAGQRMEEHQVHERAWVVIVSGDVDVSAAEGETVNAAAGHMFEFDARERHQLIAQSEARVLLLLAPWPGDGHPGAMSLEDKASARERAAAQSGD